MSKPRLKQCHRERLVYTRWYGGCAILWDPSNFTSHQTFPPDGKETSVSKLQPSLLMVQAASLLLSSTPLLMGHSRGPVSKKETAAITRLKILNQFWMVRDRIKINRLYRYRSVHVHTYYVLLDALTFSSLQVHTCNRLDAMAQL